MASITYILPIEINGSIGELTFQSNVSGNIVRLKPKPKYFPSNKIIANQLSFKNAVAYYATLSLDNRLLWTTFAENHDHVNEFGEKRTLSGFQWFVSCALNLYELGYPYIDTPPTWSDIIPIEQFILYADITGLFVVWSTEQFIDEVITLVYFQSPRKSSTIYNRRNINYAGTISVVNVFNVNITSLFETLFNVTWSAFYPVYRGSLVCHIKNSSYQLGLCSAYTSAKLQL